jgi:LmbE family N-acetylglucosaminyl deacetylase
MADTPATISFPDFYIPDGVIVAEAQARTSHLGIGAHPDDLEFMAYHGISACYQEPMHWFSAITCTDGGGSVRSLAQAQISPLEFKNLRANEQRRAAKIGQYSFVQQLGYSSQQIKTRAGQASLVQQLESTLLRTQPEVLYTHNPADKHPSHLAICLAALAAIRRMPPYSRPKKVYGCELWRDLDWLSEQDKIALDASAHPELAEKLNACFESQIAGGKRYDRAVLGRRRANATFYDAHNADSLDQLWLAMDLTELIEHENDADAIPLHDFMQTKLQRMQASILDVLKVDR